MDRRRERAARAAARAIPLAGTDNPCDAADRKLSADGVCPEHAGNDRLRAPPCRARRPDAGLFDRQQSLSRNSRHTAGYRSALDERPLDDRLGGGVRDRHRALDRQRPVQRFLQLSAASHPVRRCVLLDRRAGDGTRQLRDSRLDHQASRPRRPVDECRGGEPRGKPLRSAPSGDCRHRREPPGKDARDGEEPRVAAPATGASLAGTTQSRVVPQPVRARRLRPRRHVVAADTARSRRTLAHDRAPCARRRGCRHVRGARWRRAASSGSVVDCDGKSRGATGHDRAESRRRDRTGSRPTAADNGGRARRRASLRCRRRNCRTRPSACHHIRVGATS